MTNIDWNKVTAFGKIIKELNSKGIFFEILENMDIEFEDEQYDEGIAIIEKYLPGFGKQILN